MAALLSGFLLGLSLIVAIGAQNAFVLRQGIIGQNVLAVCLACALSDALLIGLGVFGLSGMVEAVPALVPLLRWGGVAFLLASGLRAARAAFATDAGLVAAGAGFSSLGRTLWTCLALTWLNPHVYLDTVLLIGSIATQYEDRAAFGLGAVVASFVFFFSLGFGARFLRPLFARPAAWRVLEGANALIMWSIAAKLVFE